MMYANDLELISLNSTSEPIDHIKPGELGAKLKAFLPEPAFAVVFLDDRVLAGRWTGSLFQFHNGQPIEEKHIQKLRVFNSNKELHAWRTSNGIKARLRTDDFKGEDIHAVVAHQVLSGTQSENNGNGFSELSEKRGARLFVPFEIHGIDEKKERLFIKTHNYVEYNPIGQATYTDCRFVSFTDSKKQDLA